MEKSTLRAASPLAPWISDGGRSGLNFYAERELQNCQAHQVKVSLGQDRLCIGLFSNEEIV